MLKIILNNNNYNEYYKILVIFNKNAVNFTAFFFMLFTNSKALLSSSNEITLQLDSDLDSTLIWNGSRNNDIGFPASIKAKPTDSIHLYYGATSDTYLENWKVIGGTFISASRNRIEAQWDNKSKYFFMGANEIDDSEG